VKKDGDSVSGLKRAPREWVASQFGRIEDVVYVCLGLLLAACAVALLISAAAQFIQALSGGLADHIVEILDRLLLVLLVIEILFTVTVSFREHTLIPEPFLIIGLIAGIRRVLLVTAELPHLLEKGDTAFRNGMIELGVLAFLLLALVISIVLLRRGASVQRS
jgi:uncharacterized membrane protein (DUF373 family)